MLGLRVGVLTNGSTTAIGDVKLRCPTAAGSEVLLPNADDTAGLTYTDVVLNGGDGEDQSEAQRREPGC